MVLPTPGASPATSSFSSFSAQYGGGMPTAGTGAPTAAAGSQPLFVFMGTGVKAPPDGVPFYETNYKSSERIHIKQRLATEVLSHFERMSPDKQRDMFRLLVIGGFTSQTVPLDKVDEFVKEASLDDAITAYSTLLKTASDYWMNSGLAVTPEDVLKSRVGYRMKAAGVKWNGNLDTFSKGINGALKSLMPDKGPKTLSTTTKSTDFLNPADAKNLVRQTLQNELGRDPTQAEYEDFLSAIHAAERDDPTTRTTTSTYKYDPATSQYRLDNQDQTVHQGITAAGLEQLAQERAQKQPGWAEWQAMGTYAPALFQALGSAVPGA